MRTAVSAVALACVVGVLTSWSGPAARAVSLRDSALLSAPEGVDLTQKIRYFAPNDPYYSQQWHLANGSGYSQVNVVPAWAVGATGMGVTIGIVDDCLQISHPDLSPNYVAADSWDFGQNDADPSPVYSDDRHGTSVAGVAAGRGDNLLGITGAAPYAGLAGLRIDFPNQTEAMFVNATLYHSSGGNTNIKVKNHSYGIGVGFVPSDNEVNALETSADAGTIHAAAAGNERDFHEVFLYYDGDANKKQFQNSPDSIAVAALGADGRYSYYSNWGANVWVTAPSSDDYGAGDPGITTTDRTGEDGYNYTGAAGEMADLDYTQRFGGTSSASPLVAGILALGKEVNPAMDVRMAKHLLARTSDVVDPGDASSTGGWQTNAAGYQFNQNYGFGVIDAAEFTQWARRALEVTPATTEDTGLVTVNQGIPDGSGGLGTPSPGASVTETFNLSSTDRLEEVEVTLDIDHTWRGDLEAFLTSPLGTTSRLFYHNYGDPGDFGAADQIDWTFTSNEFWGEIPLGEWSLSVHDVFAGDTGTWNSFSVLANMGTLVMVPEPSTLALWTLGLLCLGFCRRRKTR